MASPAIGQEGISAPDAHQDLRVRAPHGWGPRLVAGATGHPHSTFWKVLHHHGIARPPRAVKEPANRYEWRCPGDLLHMDWQDRRSLELAISPATRG